MDIANTYRYEAGKSNMHDSLTWTSTIELQNPELKHGELYYYEGIKGVKTGTIPESGHNYISTIEKDGYHYMLIVIGSTPIADPTSFFGNQKIFIIGCLAALETKHWWEKTKL